VPLLGMLIATWPRQSSKKSKNSKSPPAAPGDDDLAPPPTTSPAPPAEDCTKALKYLVDFGKIVGGSGNSRDIGGLVVPRWVGHC